MKNNFKKKENKGFVAILAVVLVSMMLAMLIGITSNSYKEFSLAAFAKESKYAFFAADTGMECAQYYDNRAQFDIGLNQAPSITCAGKQISFDVYNDAKHKTEFRFDMPIGIANGVNRNSCVKIIIEKDFQYNGASHTKIQSFGYNKVCSAVDSADKSIVERALRMIYENDIIAP